MASFALTNCLFTVGGTALSSFVRSINFTKTADELDDTAMGDTAHSLIGGLLNSEFTVEFVQDFAAGGPDVTLTALVGTTAAVTYKPVNTTTSPTNPLYTVTCLVSQYDPVAGTVGDLATCSATFKGAGTVVRTTA